LNSRATQILFLLSICLFSFQLVAQDLEPRLLSAVPIKGNFAIASYGYSSGNILIDNTLPIEDLNAKLNIIVLAYARSFKLFNKLTKFDVIVPYSNGEFEAVVSNIDTSTSRNGFGDPLLRLSMILVGTPPADISGFFKQEQKKFKLGVSVRLRPPLGQYDPTKLINLGANRWGIKLGLAGSYTIRKKLILEAHLISWFFTKNKAFFNGNTIQQEPLLSAQIHVSYVFKPGIWLAVSAGRNALGQTIVNGVEKEELQSNSRLGAAFGYRINKSHGLKMSFTSGFSTRIGSDFDTLLLAYQFMWFDKKNDRLKYTAVTKKL
jgi:Putative MetA-pathway of phenol degradation